jgi:ATP-dependent DNA helicase RecG
MEKKDLLLSHVVCLDRIQKGYPVSTEATKELKRLKLIEWKNPYYIISEPIAHATDEVARYIKNRGFDNEWYRKLIVDFIRINKSANRKEVEGLLMDKLPDILSSQQKFEKISSLLRNLRKKNIIINSGSDVKPNWILNKFDTP